MSTFDPKEKGYKWTFIVYPDSAPDEWVKLLDNMIIPCCISPLHEPETDGKDEEKLKQHWHVILDYGKSVKTRKQVRKICQELLHGTDCEIIKSPIGMYEYLIHKNHPDRQQFEKGFDQIKHMNGFDLEEYLKISDSDLFAEVLQIIDDNNFTEFALLVAYLREEQPDLLKAMRKDAYFINTYLRSKRMLYLEWLRESKKDGK